MNDSEGLALISAPGPGFQLEWHRARCQIVLLDRGQIPPSLPVLVPEMTTAVPKKQWLDGWTIIHFLCKVEFLASAAIISVMILRLCLGRMKAGSSDNIEGVYGPLVVL